MKLLKPLLGTLLIAGLLSVNSANAGAVLDKIMSSKTIKIATDANWPPQSFINDDNKMDGFDVDVAREIAKRLGAEVEFITPNWDVITAGNWYGRWDMHVGSMTPTKQRAKVLSFPAVYYYTPASVAVHKSSKVSQVSALSGMKIGTGTGTTFELYLNHDLVIDAEGAPAFSYEIDNPVVKSYETSVVALDDLRLGNGVRLDGVVSSLPTILEAINNGYPLKVVGTPVFYEPLAVTVDLGDNELNAKVASIVAAMRTDGTLTTISKKWYGVDYATVK
ncbi:transporter substrate-binding domain-containing protein [Oceanospirillaceae bacterium]|jgi:polar amino acid transport system substrate-binding protein|nr:transporter substrate-binding domain-containing protein [Oceanospirillaceae bacterium]MBT4997158.1 transporter substrate-binding domain-containing protein [Oceanospirillaceae bacterium]MBT5628894.1 transporter substrate-binding domain-containing protein [Oceanospirillaceae bacterium]MBT6101884.1 transporter substrate-binding domain-containing protein [Oceanospirillaceae bacterium]MBT7674827.1 transporter substrate-binding domain-containing protein [Oceanospirillaceae bacterium]|tara:strand:- start:1045 stop:1875 length:831 start_codon:yes stop_codon:yes gene_type:complete